MGIYRGEVSKNTKSIDGINKFKRWTVLDVEEKSIDIIKQYARENRVSTGKAFDIIVQRKDVKLNQESE